MAQWWREDPEFYESPKGYKKVDSITEFRGRNRFLSNFWPVKIVVNGVEYPSVEHAYQAEKCDPTDMATRRKFAECQTPGDAKRLGRLVKLRADWDQMKPAVMLGLLRQKFQDNALAHALNATGDAELIEGNNWNDTYWGVCRGVGQNHLGKLLMLVRDELRVK